MKKHVIQSKGTNSYNVEADKYLFADGFFNFYTHDNEQLFTIDADVVKTIRVESGE